MRRTRLGPRALPRHRHRPGRRAGRRPRRRRPPSPGAAPSSPTSGSAATSTASSWSPTTSRPSTSRTRTPSCAAPARSASRSSSTSRGERPGQPAGPRRGQHQPHRHLPRRRSATASAAPTPSATSASAGRSTGWPRPRLVIEGLHHHRRRLPHPAGLRPRRVASTSRASASSCSHGTPLQGPPGSSSCWRPLDQVTDTVFEGTGEAANQVFQVLRSATAPIQIPGLGSIALGKVRGQASGKRATSEAMALGSWSTAGGRRQLVELGSANARIGAPAPGRRLPRRRHGAGLPGAAGRAPLRRRPAQVAAVRGHPGPDADLPRPLRRRCSSAWSPTCEDVTYTHRRQPGREARLRQGLTGTRDRVRLGPGRRPGHQRRRELACGCAARSASR